MLRTAVYVDINAWSARIVENATADPGLAMPKSGQFVSHPQFAPQSDGDGEMEKSHPQIGGAIGVNLL